MNQKEAKDLSTTVVKQSDCVIRFGRTNGRSCLHLRLIDADDPSRSSVTIYDEIEWQYHAWNKTNKPRKRKADEPKVSFVEAFVDDVIDTVIASAIANKEAQ